ncbi:MAG: SAM-dependent methyltransferase [Proteobacteria bacterium]|nr:SAM-dependent methyltransferase [Pseudomonadota bacterium]
MTTEWSVGVMLGVSGGYWRGCALQAGVRLKIFSVLGSGPKDAFAVAHAIGSEVRATGLLLDALAAMHLLVKTDGSYKNSEFAGKFLDAGLPGYMGHIILHHHHILDGWAQLDAAVMTGAKVVRRSYGADIERESFLLGMFNLAMGIAPRLVAQFDLTGRKRLLDLGGGPGTYAIHFCLLNPDLTAVILDRPTTEPFARKTVARFQLAERIGFIGGDFNTDPISGGPYDVAWLSHILHSNSPEECQECIDKTVAALVPGGLILIHDFILDDSKDGPEFAALFSLNMLVGTDGGRSYSRAEIFAMLEQAGVRDVSHRKCSTPNDSSVIVGVKR